MMYTHTQLRISALALIMFCVSCSSKKDNYSSGDTKPNVIFILLDDLGYGHLGMYNDTTTIEDFDPYFVNLVDSLQGYSLENSLEFTRIATPTLDKLAREGVIFSNAYTSSNLCAPSRLGIATGILQNRMGVYSNDDCELRGITQGTHLAERLKQLNYKTAHIGKWHIGKREESLMTDILKKHSIDTTTNYYLLPDLNSEVFTEVKNTGFIGSVVKEQHPLENGFDYYYGYNHWASQYYGDLNVWENYTHAGKQVGYNTDVFTDKAIQFMSDQLEDNKPFYLQLHYHAVHDSVEIQAPGKYLDRFNDNSFELNNFYAHIYGVDQNIRRIISFLKENEKYENTMIIFTSDNGGMTGGSYDGNKSGSPLPGNTPFAGHKGTLHAGGSRVPMFIHWPDRIGELGTRSNLVSTMDILPTVIEAAKGVVPSGLDGKSLLPVLDNDKVKVHEHLLWAGMHAYKWGYLINKSTEEHKTESAYAPPGWVVVKDDYLLRFVGTREPGIYYDYLEGSEPVFELFNLKNDPAERNNIADKLPEKVEELSEIFRSEAKDFLEPKDWPITKWKELIEFEDEMKN